MAPVSPLGAVVSWEEDDSDGEAKTVLGTYCVASAEGMARLVVNGLSRLLAEVILSYGL